MASVSFPNGVSPGTRTLQFSDLTRCDVSDTETNNDPQP